MIDVSVKESQIHTPRFVASGEMCECWGWGEEGIIVFRSIGTSDYECRKDHLLCVMNLWGKINECGNAKPVSESLLQ
jgi:hypothetical protein